MEKSREKEVLNWLCEIFGGEENVPSFEHNMVNYSKIATIMEQFKDDELDQTCIAKSQDCQMAEMKDETLKTLQHISSLGFDYKSNCISSLVDSLSLTSDMLALDDPGEAAMNMQITDLRLKASKVPLERYMKKSEKNKNTKAFIEDSSMRNKTEQALAVATTEMNMNMETIAKTRKKAAFMQEKQREYLDLQEKCILLYN